YKLFKNRKPEFLNEQHRKILIDFYDEKKGGVEISAFPESDLNLGDDGVVEISIGKVDFNKLETFWLDYPEFEEFIKDYQYDGFVKVNSGEEVRFSSKKKENKNKIESRKKEVKKPTLEEFEKKYKYGERFLREGSEIVAKLIKYSPEDDIVLLKEENKSGTERNESFRDFEDFYELASERNSLKKKKDTKKVDTNNKTLNNKKNMENFNINSFDDVQRRHQKMFNNQDDMSDVEEIEEEKDSIADSQETNQSQERNLGGVALGNLEDNEEKIENSNEKGTAEREDIQAERVWLETLEDRYAADKESDPDNKDMIEKYETEIEITKRKIEGKPPEGKTEEEQERYRKHMNSIGKEEFDEEKDNEDVISFDDLKKEKTPETKTETSGAEKEIEWSIEMLGLENRSVWSKMSESGKNFFSDIFNDLKAKIPEPGRYLGKLSIAFNQIWLSRNEKKAAEIKGKIDAWEKKRDGLKKAKDEINGVVERLKEQGIPGVESLQVKINDIDRKDAKFLAKKDELQTKLEARDNTIALYANKRDRIANGLIEEYDKKLNPMESELKSLDAHKEKINALSAKTEKENKKNQDTIDELERKKNKIKESYRLMGMKERQIRKDDAIKILDETIVNSQTKIKESEKLIAEKKAVINEEISRMDRKANPYRDRREEFVRVKEGRPLRVKTEKRKQSDDFMKAEEDVRINNREKEEPVDDFEEAVNDEQEESENDSQEKNESVDNSGVENSAEKENTAKVSQFIIAFNKKVVKYFGKESEFIIKSKEFLNTNKIKEDEELETINFNKMLDKYYKSKKLSLAKEMRFRDHK
ncbi:MAG: hypothetical protein PF549_03485, partial [Patescibacteria group bacterium]|nr:hypothetical protein [Patescibacteria group bacterium]